MRAAAIAVMSLGLIQAACAEPTAVAFGEREQTPVSISVNLANAPTVASVRLRVTASDLASPIESNLPIVDGEAKGTVSVPAGSQRTFTLQALDAGGVVRYEGSRTVDVVPGLNPALTIVLEQLDGEVPIIGVIEP